MSVRTLANIYSKVLAPLKRTASWRRSYDVHEQRQKVRVDTPSGMGSKGQHEEKVCSSSHVPQTRSLLTLGKRTRYWHRFFHKPGLEKPHVGVSKPSNNAIHINNNPSSLYVASRRSDILDTEENEPEDVYLDPISTDTTSGDHGFIEDYLNQSLTTLARLTPSSSASNVLYKALKEGSYDDILSLRDSDAQEALDVMQEVSQYHPTFACLRIPDSSSDII